MEAVVQATPVGRPKVAGQSRIMGANDGETAQEEEHGRVATAVVTVLARPSCHRRDVEQCRDAGDDHAYHDEHDSPCHSFAGSGSTRARCVKNTAPQTRRAGLAVAPQGEQVVQPDSGCALSSIAFG